MDKKKLNNIYFMVCNDEVITEESLKSRGFTDSEIDYLFDEDRLYQQEDGTYFISYVEDLVDFAKETLEDKVYGIANRAVNKAYELSPTNFEVLTLKFREAFVQGNRKKTYYKAVKFLYEMREVADENEIKDVNTYIYLLNMITDLPDDLRLTAKYYRLHDLTINQSDERFEDLENRNDMRKNIYYQKFSTALKITRKLDDKNFSNMAYDAALVKLTEEVTSVRKSQTIFVKDLAKDDKLDEIILLYEEEEKKRKLTRNEEYTLKLVHKLLDIKNNKIVPNITHTTNGKYYDMVDNNDFKEALKRVSEISRDNNSQFRPSTNYILLTKIIEEIDKIKGKSKEYTKNNNN